jgi:hypothetical protein
MKKQRLFKTMEETQQNTGPSPLLSTTLNVNGLNSLIKRYRLTEWIKKYTTICLRPQTLKLLEENIGLSLQDIVTSNNFLDRTPKHRKLKQE